MDRKKPDVEARHPAMRTVHRVQVQTYPAQAQKQKQKVHPVKLQRAPAHPVKALQMTKRRRQNSS